MDVGAFEPLRMKAAVLMEECMSYFNGDYSKFFPQDETITECHIRTANDAIRSGVF